MGGWKSCMCAHARSRKERPGDMMCSRTHGLNQISNSATTKAEEKNKQESRACMFAGNSVLRVGRRHNDGIFFTDGFCSSSNVTHMPPSHSWAVTILDESK